MISRFLSLSHPINEDRDSFSRGAMTLREAARRAGRDVKAVHGDAHALLAAGVLRKNASGKIEFPFDSVHVDFMLEAA